MAMTLQAAPAALSSIQGDLIFTVAYPAHVNDPGTYPNYKFIGDVYVGATLVARVKRVPNPVTGIGIFNIGNIVRNYIDVVFSPAPANILAQVMGNGEFCLKVTMKFGEEYSFTAYTNQLIDSERTFFNNYNGKLLGTTTSLSGMSDKPLTNRPLTTPVKRDAAFNLISFLPSDTDDFTLRIKTYNYAGTLVQGLNFAITPASAYQLHVLNFSKPAINSVEPDMINDSIKYYTVEFDTPNISDDATLRFDISGECIYTKYTLHFLNKFGGFESKDFIKVSRKTIDIQKKDFGKLPYTVSPSGVVSYANSNNVYNETKSIYSSIFKEKMSLNSDLLTDGEYRWLGELIISPMVYLEDSGYFYPVIITDSSYEERKFINDELTNLTINIDFGQNFNAQFR